MEDVLTYRSALMHHINALLDKGVDLKVEEFGGAIQLCDKADVNLVDMMGLFPSYFSEGIDLDTIYNCMLHAVVNGIAIERPNAIWVAIARDIVAFLEGPNAPQTVVEMASFSCFILSDFLEAYKPP
jgi:hypothetical protein